MPLQCSNPPTGAFAGRLNSGVWAHMKHFRIFLILAATIIAAGCAAGDRTVGPIGPGGSFPADYERAKSLGFTIGHPYAKARDRLLALSWRPDLGWGLSGVRPVLGYPGYPEILCGEGMDAVCTARLTKGTQAILLTIDPDSDTSPVVHVNRDDAGEP